MLEILNRYDLRGEDLTVPQFAILNHATMEGVPLSEISAKMLCDNSNLTGIVDRLISKKLVERRPDTQDRRVSLICLTQEGVEKLRSIRPRHYESVSQRMNILADEEVGQLRSLLYRLYQGLGDVLQEERGIQVVGTKHGQGLGNGNGHSNGTSPATARNGSGAIGNGSSNPQRAETVVKSRTSGEAMNRRLPS